MGDEYELYEPCPHCGSTDLIQTIEQQENVELRTDGEGGNIEHIEPRDTMKVLDVWCPECDEMIWEKD